MVNALMPASSTTTTHELGAARDYALAIIRLATGRPTPGGLLMAYDHRETLRKLHEDVLGPLGAEDTRLIGLAVALVRAAADAEKKGHLDRSHRNNYYARLEDACRASVWAKAYVARTNRQTSAALVRKSGGDDLGTVPIADQMTQVVIQNVHDGVEADIFTLPGHAPRATKDRRKPTSIYARVAGGPQPIATKVSVRF